MTFTMSEQLGQVATSSPFSRSSFEDNKDSFSACKFVQYQSVFRLWLELLRDFLWTTDSYCTQNLWRQSVSTCTVKVSFTPGLKTEFAHINKNQGKEEEKRTRPLIKSNSTENSDIKCPNLQENPEGDVDSSWKHYKNTKHSEDDR